MEWKKVKLGEIGEIITGKTPSTKNLAYYDHGDILFIGPSDLNSCTKHIYSSEKHITLEGRKSLGKNVIPKGAICVSCIGTIGYVGVSSSSCATNQQINSIVVKDGINTDFIYYCMKNMWYIFKSLEGQSTTLSILNKSHFANLDIDLPPLETQRRIAAILSSLDDKIENNNRINRNLEAQAQALFKSWFVDFEPWGGVMQEDWKDGTLDEICTQLREKVGRKDDVKVLSPVTTGNLMLSEEYFTKQVYSQSIAKYIVVPPTAFAYNPARVNIGSLGMNEFDFDGCVSPVYVVFECKDGYEYFFDLFRRTNQFKEEVKSRAIGGVRQTLGYDDFKSIQTVIPPKRIVDEFNKIYTSMLDVSNANKRENQYLAALRDTLLPKLMRGEITL